MGNTRYTLKYMKDDELHTDYFTDVMEMWGQVLKLQKPNTNVSSIWVETKRLLWERKD